MSDYRRAMQELVDGEFGCDLPSNIDEMLQDAMAGRWTADIDYFANYAIALGNGQDSGAPYAEDVISAYLILRTAYEYAV